MSSDDDKINARIDTATREYVRAAEELAQALLEKLGAQAPALAGEVARALGSGERLVLAMEFSPTAPCVWWSSIDDYQTMRRIMTVPCGGQSRH
ncbi:MAG: hypothetical protein J0L89_08450 [Xanthomonadales bacterium]|nr:hypothetical protein [Xanthomonadales bacterium]